jgi:phosphotransferase system HPr-like phosphotransfer protein
VKIAKDMVGIGMLSLAQNTHVKIAAVGVKFLLDKLEEN